MRRDVDSNPDDDFAPVGGPKDTGNGFSGTDDYRGEIGYGSGSKPSNGGLGTWDPSREVPEV